MKKSMIPMHCFTVGVIEIVTFANEFIFGFVIAFCHSLFPFTTPQSRDVRLGDNGCAIATIAKSSHETSLTWPCHLTMTFVRAVYHCMRRSRKKRPNKNPRPITNMAPAELSQEIQAQKEIRLAVNL
jgi:hypothetical protein